MLRLLALAAALAAIAVPPAHASPAPWIGTFHVTVGGGDVDDQWTQHHEDAGPCDVASTGSGSETGTLTPGGPPAVLSMAGAGSVGFLVGLTNLRAVATLNRQGTITEGQPQADDTQDAGCPGGGDDSEPAAPDCGPSTLRLSFTLLPGSSPGLSAETEGDDTRYRNCPTLAPVLPAIPSTLTAPAAVTGVGPAPLPPVGDLALIGTDVVSDADVDATSRLTVRLRIERVAAVAAFDVPDSFTEVKPDARGDVTIPAACPKGARCRGTVGIAVSDIGSEARADVPPRWPKPLLTPEPLLGKARFSVKGGKRARVRVRLASGSKAALQALSGERLDVVVHQRAGRGHTVAFVAGQVRLKAH